MGVLSGKSTKSGDRTCVKINAYDDIKSFVCLKDLHCAALQPHFILENAVERMRYPLLRSEWHMDYAVIWLATVGILCGWKS